MRLKKFKDNLTSEHVMLVIMLVISFVFFIEPIIDNYPDDARVFPQLTAAAVFIGSALLLSRNYLPGPLRTFVSESVSITSDDSEIELDDKEVMELQDETQTEGSQTTDKKETLGTKYGYEMNDTAFMIGTAVLFFIAGWAAGFLIVTPIYVLFYTLWYRVDLVTSILLAILATVIMYVFVWALIMPFDRGAVFDFSPLLPLHLDGLAMATALLWGGR